MTSAANAAATNLITSSPHVCLSFVGQGGAVKVRVFCGWPKRAMLTPLSI
jgi:hypothetical protein